MGRFWKTAIMVCVCYLGAAMVIAPTSCIAAASGALRLCAEVVIPSLFPFFVCSNLLIGLGVARTLSRYLSKLMRPLFGIPGGGALAVVLGVVSGDPVGAECIAGLDASGSCTKAEAERMLSFCNNSGPLFVMGAVGIGMLGNQKLGVLLYGIHVVSALLTGLLFKGYGKNRGNEPMALPPAIPLLHPAAAVGTAVADAVTSICKVCGFVMVFAVLTAALPDRTESRVVYAFLEITGGIRALLQMESLGQLLLPAVAFFLALSGVSVLLQVAGIVLPEGISLKPYLLGKLTQGMLAFLLTYLALRLLPGARETFLMEVPPAMVPDPMGYLIVSVMALVWSLLAIGLVTLGVWLYERWSNHRKNRFR